MSDYVLIHSDELWHYGVPGQKRGIRRYQNPDGSLTAAGRERYGRGRSLVRGTLNRQMAYTYETNERYYNKRAEKLKSKGRNYRRQAQLASMNRAAKNEYYKKAAAADEKARRRRAAKAQKRLDKVYSRSVSSLKK